MSRRKHVPIRSCIGCGDRSAQGEMLRVIHDATGRLVLDRGRRAGGRGAYLHQDEACWVRFVRRKGIVRSLRAAFDRQARAVLLADLQRGVE